MIDILLRRLSTLEAKVAKMDQNESKINSLQIEIDHSKKYNSGVDHYIFLF